MGAKFDLAGRGALVTGGGTGLGLHMTKALAEAGANVVISARREGPLRETSDKLNAQLGRKAVHWQVCDLEDRSSVRALAAGAEEQLGKVDIFIGNAGQDINEHLATIKDESIDQIMQVNISANVELVRAFAPGMRGRKWGRVLFSSSVATVLATPHEGVTMYSATKGALNAMTRTLAAELGHDGITVNALVLGFFVTDMVKEAHALLAKTQGAEAADGFMRDFVSCTALGRAGDPAELEGLIQLLASNAGSYITGSNLVIDGGLSIMLRPHAVA